MSSQASALRKSLPSGLASPMAPIYHPWKKWCQTSSASCSQCAASSRLITRTCKISSLPSNKANSTCCRPAMASEQLLLLCRLLWTWPMKAWSPSRKPFWVWSQIWSTSSYTLLWTQGQEGDHCQGPSCLSWCSGWQGSFDQNMTSLYLAMGWWDMWSIDINWLGLWFLLLTFYLAKISSPPPCLFIFTTYTSLVRFWFEMSSLDG